jgi:hypothetical protein
MDKGTYFTIGAVLGLFLFPLVLFLHEAGQGPRALIIPAAILILIRFIIFLNESKP